MTFLHPIFSPRGGLEGAMVHIDGEPSQLVFEPAPHLEEAIAALREGDVFEARIGPLPAGGKGPAAHPLHALVELGGRPPAQREGACVATTGQVVRLNYARHGEANGVVLDNGDFVHLRPHGQRQAGLEVGDRVEASGAGRALRFGTGRVIEAERVNGQAVEATRPHPPKATGHAKPKPPAPHADAAR